LRRRERAKSEFRRRNIFELYIEEVVEACNRLKGGKLPKEKLKEQLQKIAMKRTGGEKVDEILGYDGGGPEGLPHSIIVTAEGTEGDAPVLDVRDEIPTQQESLIQKVETAGAARSKSKAKSKKQPGAAKAEKVSRPKSRSENQMSLGFEPAGANEKRGQKTGKKHGAKKAKK
jgi:DNA topoisomerase-6 subunit B